jgi:hypothetical protein
MRLELLETIKIWGLVEVSNSFLVIVAVEVLLGHRTRLLANKLLSIRILEVPLLREKVMGKEAKQIINRISEENLPADFSHLDIRCLIIHLHSNTISLKRMFKRGVLNKQNSKSRALSLSHLNFKITELFLVIKQQPLLQLNQEFYFLILIQVLIFLHLVLKQQQTLIRTVIFCINLMRPWKVTLRTNPQPNE